MRLIGILYVLAAGSSLMLAQGTGSIEGVVTDDVTRGPVRKAQVMLLSLGGPPIQSPADSAKGIWGFDPSIGPPLPTKAPTQSYVAVTDSVGSFAFRDLAPGAYAVQVQHPRYPMRSGGPMFQDVEVKANDVSRLAVSLIGGASISGRIVDEDDDPIAGCTVQLRAPDGALVALGDNFETQSSNELGQYRVDRLTAGKYIAVAQCMRPVFQPRPFSAGPPPAPSFGYPHQYYPQAANLQSAGVIEVTAGAERTGIDFRMKPARVYTVAGTISGIERRDQANVSVMLSTPDSDVGMRNSHIDPATGGFVLQGVFAGSYVLTANQPPTNPQVLPMAAWQPLEVTDRSLQVNLKMRKPVDIPGKFVVEGDRSVLPQQIQIQIMPERQIFNSIPPEVEMQPDGTFYLKNVFPGEWHLTASGPSIFLRAIEAGGQTLPGHTLDTSKGLDGPLRLFISTKTASLRAKGTPGMMYTLVPDGEKTTDPQVAQADPQQGAVSIEGLAPGKYIIYEGTVRDEAALLQTVILTEGAVVEVDLK